jgi:hypothetical protein
LQISRKGKDTHQKINTFIDFNDGNDHNQTTYCSKCYHVGVLSVLQPRLYKANEPLPHDANRWKQCYRCGKIVSVNDVKHDTEISEVVDIDDNSQRFYSVDKDKDKSNAGISRYKSRRKHTITDPDILREIHDHGVDNVVIHREY